MEQNQNPLMKMDINRKLTDLIEQRNTATEEDLPLIERELLKEIALNARLFTILTNEIKSPDDKTATCYYEMIATPDGDIYMPVYTNPQAMALRSGREGEHVRAACLPFSDLARIAGNKATIVINLYSDRLMLPPEHIASMMNFLSSSAKKGFSSSTTTKDQAVAIQDPVNCPTELTDALIAYAKSRNNINRLWLRVMVEQNGDKKYLTVIDFDGDVEDVMSGLFKSIPANIVPNNGMNAVPYDSYMGKMSVIDNAPLYSKEKA